MIYIVHGTDKGSETSENAVPSKRRWIQGEAVTEQVDRDDSQQELIMETSEVSDDGRIKEIDFIECVRSMAQIFYTREKKERKVPVYDWKLLRLELESKDIGLKPFLNLLEKLINPSGRGLRGPHHFPTAERPLVLMLFSCRDWKQTYKFIEKGYCDVSKSFRYL